LIGKLVDKEYICQDLYLEKLTCCLSRSVMRKSDSFSCNLSCFIYHCTLVPWLHRKFRNSAAVVVARPSQIVSLQHDRSTRKSLLCALRDRSTILA